MDQGQNTGGGDEEVSYADRGEDNIEDLTRSDEAMMDRVSQAGVAGAFGAADDTELRQTMRDDAESAFGGDQAGGSGGS